MFYINAQIGKPVMGMSPEPAPNHFEVSDEVRDAIRANPTWLWDGTTVVEPFIPVPEPYIPTRADIERQRQSRYTQEADPLYLEAQEDAARTGQPVDLTAWLAKKDQIRQELPYPA